MNGKRIFGILLILAGIGLYFYCQHGKGEMLAARKKIQTAEGILPNAPIVKDIPDPITDAAKAEAYRRVDKYEEPIRLCFIGSGVLVVAGFLFIIFGTKKKKRK